VVSLPTEPELAWARLIAGPVETVYIEDGLSFVTHAEAYAAGHAPNTRARVLAMARDPDAATTPLFGDIVAVGGPTPTVAVSAPGWLRDLMARPGRFHILSTRDRGVTWEPLTVTFTDPFRGLAVLAATHRRAPDLVLRLARVDATPAAGS
jgi:hypothetical protein